MVRAKEDKERIINLADAYKEDVLPKAEGSAARLRENAEAYRAERLNLATLRVKLKNEIQIAAGQRRKKATKRLEVVEDLIESGNRPEWMIFRILPVLPP